MPVLGRAFFFFGVGYQLATMVNAAAVFNYYNNKPCLHSVSTEIRTNRYMHVEKLKTIMPSLSLYKYDGATIPEVTYFLLYFWEMPCISLPHSSHVPFPT